MCSVHRFDFGYYKWDGGCRLLHTHSQMMNKELAFVFSTCYYIIALHCVKLDFKELKYLERELLKRGRPDSSADSDLTICL